MSFVVRTRDDLRYLLKPEGLMHPFRKPRAVIHVSGMSAPEAGDWESRLERFRQECGCSAGTFALCGFIVLFIAYAVLSEPDSTGDVQRGALLLKGAIFFTGLILSALIGKFISLCVATLRFRRTCYQLEERLRILEAASGRLDV
jgi:hypothetical protein